MDNDGSGTVGSKYMDEEDPLLDEDPLLNTDGVLRASGRLKRSAIDINEVHLVILPRGNLITESIVACCHEHVSHSGRSMTLNNLRRNGLWAISVSSVV